MLKTVNKLFPLLAAVVLISGLSACKKNDSKTTDENPPVVQSTYSLRVSSGSPAAEYILQTGSLTSGTATLAGTGVATTLTTITARNGFYYGMNDAGNLVKYTSNNKVNTVVKEIPFTQISWAYYASFYKWKDDKTLVLFSSNGSVQFEYAILNVETMAITASGKINVPGLLKDHYFWGYAATITDNKVNLTYTQNANGGDNLSVDTTYLATFDYPAMNNVKVTKDTRFTLPEHYSLNMPNSFVENGNSYFIASPNIWTTSNKNKPFGIYRIKNGASQIDPDYFYELTDRNKEEAMGLFYIGNGKAIVKFIDKTQITDYKSYSVGYIADYYVVDVVNQTKTKLNIPKSISGSFIENVLVENGIVSIAAQTADGYYIYQYNPSTSAVTRGLKLEGITSLSRLEKL